MVGFECRVVLGALAAGFAAWTAQAGDLADVRATVAKGHTVTRVDKFYGYDRVVFDFQGYEAWVVCPSGPVREGRPWTWTMQWATAFVPRTGVPQLLADGYHHVTIITYRNRMDETGLRVSADFQRFLVDELRFAPKANLIGMSWGGFFSIRYANRHPENVGKIYLDAPLLCFKDFRTGIGPWEARQPADGWANSPEMPVNMAARVAAAGIPILLLYGGCDTTCVPAQNCEPFERRFRAAGGDIRTIKRGLYAHHPHGVEVNERTICDFFEKDPPAPVASCPGEADAAAGWRTVPDARGRRLISSRFKLDKTADENAWYSLSFSATGGTNGCWRVDFYDAAGKRLPDVNSLLRASADWLRYDEIVPTRPDAAEAEISFVSRTPARVRDVRMCRMLSADAAVRARAVYNEGPKIRGVLNDGNWKKLPNAKTAIQFGKNFTTVFLGDSIMNDTWCGGVDALVRAEYPDTNLRNIISCRGETGCWFYRTAENFEEYVGRHRPDLVVIGGISNWNRRDGQTVEDAEACLVETVARCRKIGAEVVLCSPAKSYDPRTVAPDDPCLRSDYIRRAAEKANVQFWDMTTPPVEAVRASGRPVGWFNRDAAHSDDCGKALNAMTMYQYFQSAQLKRY